jgi:threonyl-tRNA synthetase
VWARAESDLARALERNSLAYKLDPNEAAFYGPKIDFIIPNVFGVFEHQCATIQLDFNLPERFDLIYVDSDNSEKRPIVVHRAIYGSFERFIASVIEHTAGKFPVWLAPVQAKVLTISEGAVPYGRAVNEKLLAAGLRSELDARDDKIGLKIVTGSKEKIPYLLVVGAREAEQGTVAVRARDSEEKQAVMPLDAFISRALEESRMEF